MEYLLTGLPNRKQQMLSRLLPYWGAEIDEKKHSITGALRNRSVSVSGLTENRSEELSKFLRHTGVRKVEEGNETDLRISIMMKENTSAPITLETENATYHLKPLRKQTDDVQTWVHKRLWLPIREPTFTLAIHTREENNIPEWLCYLIVQHFMQPSFKRLTSIRFADYQELAASVLRFLNNDLALCQLTLERQTKEEWPQLPPDSNRPSPDKPENKNPLNPFLNENKPTEGEPINPFRKRNEEQRSTINPFRKNKEP